jgi:hypothetical protein
MPVLVLAIALTAFPISARAGGQTRMDGVPQVVDTLPLSAYRPRLDDRTLEQQIWDYVFWFPTGHRLLAQFQITNAGPGRHTGLVAALIVFPDKTTRLIKNSRPRDEWTYEVQNTDVRVSLARHVLDIGATRHTLHIESRVEQIDVAAQSVTPGVILEPVRYADRDRYELTVLAPRVRCTATIRLEGQAPITLTDGGGIVLHSVSTLPEYDQALNVMRLHTFDRPVQSSLLSFSVPGSRSGQSMGWLLTMPEGGPIDIAEAIDRRYGDLVKERESPGYTSPRRVQVTGRGARAVEATASLALVGRFDILGWINTAIGRFFARRFFHPVQYLFDANYDLQLGTGTDRMAASGQGFGLLWILNQPREASF